MMRGRLLLIAALSLAAVLMVCGLPASAQQPAPADATAPPEKVRELLSLMDDPSVRQWLGQRSQEPAAPEPPAAEPESARKAWRARGRRPSLSSRPA